MKKIKLCYVITRMDWGGSPDLVRLLCDTLPADRFDVTLVTGETRYPSAKTRDFFAGSRVNIVFVPGLKRDISLIDDIGALARLYFFFRKHRFDLVHTHTAKAGFVGRTAAFLAGCRCIVHTAHGHNIYGYFGPVMTRFLIILERVAASYTSRIVVVTECEGKDCLRFKICAKDKLVHINSALEPEYFRDSRHTREEIRRSLGAGKGVLVGMIGRLEPVKGAEYFIDAAKEVSGNFPGARFIVIGEGALRKALELRVAHYGLAGRFLFTGWREDIREILNGIDILVLPSLNEALGLVLLQAQAAGVPVVASRVGGVEEALVDGQTGILVSPADSKALASAIGTLLNDGAMRRSMGDRGHEWVSGRFTVEKMARDHQALYENLLRGEER